MAPQNCRSRAERFYGFYACLTTENKACRVSAICKMMSLRQTSLLAPAAKRARLSIEIKLPSSEAKDSFTAKLDSLRSILKPPGIKTLDNYGLFCAIFDALESQGNLESAESSSRAGPPDTSALSSTSSTEKSMLQSAG